MEHYTYTHQTADGRVFYVGKGKGRRAWSKDSRNVYWRSVAQKNGVQVQIAARWSTEAEAFEHEKFLICCFRGMGAKLVNFTDGGEGTSGFKQSAEHVAKRTEAVRKAMNTPEAITRSVNRIQAAIARPEVKKKMSDAMKRRWLDSESRRLLQESMVGRSRSPNNTKAIVEAVSKRIVCVETGCVYTSIEDAAKWVREKIRPTAVAQGISFVLNKESRSAYGYKWRLA